MAEFRWMDLGKELRTEAMRGSAAAQAGSRLLLVAESGSRATTRSWVFSMAPRVWRGRLRVPTSRRNVRWGIGGGIVGGFALEREAARERAAEVASCVLCEAYSGLRGSLNENGDDQLMLGDGGLQSRVGSARLSSFERVCLCEKS